MIWFYIQYYVSLAYCRLVGKEHPHDRAKKQDPFIYEE